MPPRPSTHRAATPDDVAALAALAQEHYGGTAGTWEQRLLDAVRHGERVVLAEQDGRAVAYARAGTRLPVGPEDPAPAGTWLTGAVVATDHRRQGHARRLLGLLLAELRPAGDPVWSMTDAGNEASLALHRDLGFVEVLRAPRLLGEGFSGGEGVLLRADAG